MGAERKRDLKQDGDYRLTKRCRSRSTVDLNRKYISEFRTTSTSKWIPSTSTPLRSTSKILPHTVTSSPPTLIPKIPDPNSNRLPPNPAMQKRAAKPEGPVTGVAIPPMRLLPYYRRELSLRKLCPLISLLNCGPLILSEPKGLPHRIFLVFEIRIRFLTLQFPFSFLLFHSS